MKKRVLSLLLAVAMLLPAFSFTVYAANEPTITSHKNGKSYDADDFYIKWKSVSGAKRYRLAVKSLNDGSYAADIWWNDNLTKTKYECDEDDIKPGHRYKIWVGACGSSHEDVISQYSIEVTANEVVKDYSDPLINPIKSSAGYSFVEGTKTTFSTRASDNALYKIYMYIDGKQVKKSSSDTIEYSTDSLSVGKHTIEVVAEDESGNENDTSIEVTVKKGVCTHTKTKEIYVDTERVPISGDVNSHNKTDYYDIVCSDCNETIQLYVAKNQSKEAHNFSGNKCTKCSYTKEEDICKHSKTITKAVDHKYTEYDEQNHYVTTYHDKICSDCQAIVQSGIEGSTIKENHTFSGNKCTKCSYTKEEDICKHSKTTTKAVDHKYTEYDEQNHYVTTYHDKICSDCQAIVQSGIEGSTIKENHAFSGNKCTKCSYTKEEATTEKIQQLATPKVKASSTTVNIGETVTLSWNKVTNADYYTIKVWATNESKDVTGTSYNNISFDETGTFAISVYARSYNNEVYLQSEPYALNITVIKKDEKCKHTNSIDQYFDTKITPISGDDTYHTVTHYYNKTCIDCGEILQKNVPGIPQTKEHYFYDNRCTDCEYVKDTEEKKVDNNKNVIILGVGESKGFLNGVEIRVQNSDDVSVAPYIENERTLIPLRFVSEKLGADVDWNGDEKKITICHGTTTAYYWIDNKNFVVNGVEYTDDAAPKIDDNGNTFVPIRKICEIVFGMYVHYVDNGRRKAGLIVICPIGELESDSYYNNLYNPHTHNYISTGNGKHSCSSCGITFECDKKEPCSFCGYKKPINTQKPETQTQINNVPKYYEIEDLLSRVPIIYPFNEFEEPVYNLVYKQKNDIAESWKAFARRSWSDKMDLAAQVLWGKANGNNDVYGEEMYEKILLEILAQATKNLETMSTAETTQMLLDTDEKGAELAQKAIKDALKCLDENSKLAQPIKLANSACSGIEKTMKYGKYAFALYQGFTEEYEQKAQYLLLMSEFVNATGNDTLKRAMDNIIDDFVKKSNDKFYELKEEVIDSALSVDNFIPENIMLFFKVSDFAQGLLYAFTDIDEKLKASECLGFSHLISMSFANGFYEKGKSLRKDGFDDKDNEYMRSAFELCRASSYMNYKYLSEEFTDSDNQRWINEAIHAILGKSIKSYLQ